MSNDKGKLWKGEFWKDATERAVKTAAQFGAYSLGVTAWTNVGEVVQTGQAVGFSMLFGAGLSYLTSLLSLNLGDSGTASAVELKKE